MKIERITDTLWEIPIQGGMRVPGRIYADDRLMPKLQADKAHEQVANVACLPGIVQYALAMPDAHWGYGFPIGGVAATDPDDGGVISPGGVGYDINCGVRLMTTSLRHEDIRDRLPQAVKALYQDIPSGVGSSGAIAKLRSADLEAVLRDGSKWAVQQGFGVKADLEATEEHGCMREADPKALSERALARGADQLGTLGSGNHFLELGVVETILDQEAAEAFHLWPGQITLMIHSGSRGLGYQVCDDSIRVMIQAASKYGISLPDRQLCCAPVNSSEGRRYLAAMAAAANFAWANRQIMMALSQRSLEKSLGLTSREMGARLLYDVCHNIAKFETHTVDGAPRRLLVHRKGATRAFHGDRKEIPEGYRSVGQPVLVPGDMGTGSYVCVGVEAAMNNTFGSCCHGAGRALSRTAAKKAGDPAALLAELESRDILLMARSRNAITEESPDAYKNIDVVADVLERAGLGRRVARIRPVAVVKG